MTNNAVIEFDKILKKSGFAMDYNITDELFNTETKPIAYRNISRIDAGTKPFYLLWNIISPVGKPAEDRMYAEETNIAIVFYTQDAWLFDKQDASTNTIAYHSLLNELQEHGWALEFGSEVPEIANEGSTTYVHRKDLIITKTFIGG